jgi:Flp pilus assembly protein TadG
MRRRCFQRGNFATIFALVVPALLGFTALVIDIGHFWQVRSQLQNGADAAALAGIRDLNGAAAQFPVARLSSQTLAAQHDANQTALNLNLNAGNGSAGDIILGHWDFGLRSFTVADAAMPSSRVNAVKVNARRTAAEGGAVDTFFARVFGASTQDLTANAIAVGGSPSAVCGFPLAVPACSLIDAGGAVMCQANLTFGQATTDNVGFTLLDLSNPNTPDIFLAMQAALNPGGCLETSTASGEIKVSNGNNLNKNAVQLINAAVAAAGSAGLYIDVPVLDTGTVTNAACGAVQFNGEWPIAGYVSLRLLGATDAPNRAIQTRVDCDHTSASTVGGNGFYGLPSTAVYLVQ